MRFSEEKSLRRPCLAWSRIDGIGGRVLKCVSQKKEVSGDPALPGHVLMDWWESFKMRFSKERSLKRPCLAWSRIDDWWESLKMRFSKERSLRRPCLAWSRIDDWWESLKMRFSKERSLRRPCLAWPRIDGLV